MNPITTALVGCGFSARTFHLPFLQALDSYRLSGVSTRQSDYAREALPGVQVYGSAEAMISQSEAELVVITAPNQAHFPLAKQALERGKHVLLEKPFVCNRDEGEQLIQLARTKKRLLSVYHNRRWDGDFLTLEKLMAQGRLGSIRRFESHFDRFRPQVRQRWREQPGAGAGNWFDLGSHLVDQTLQLFGPPEAVTARCLALRDDSEVTDYFHVQLHYTGREVILESSPYSAASNRRFELQGTRGSYRKEGLDPQEGRLIAGCRVTDPDWAREAPDAYGTLHTDAGSEVIVTRCGGYQHYFQALAGAIRGEGPNPVPAEEALQVIRLLELAERSSREGKTLTLDKE